MNAMRCATSSCSPIGLPHWTRSARELAGDLRRPLADPGADGRQRQAAGVERGQGDLEPLALLADHVLLRHVDIGVPGLGVLDPAQPHELDARLDLHAVGVARDDERGDAAPAALAARHLGHHHEDIGDRPVGRPQLAAVEHVARAVLGRGRDRRDPRRIRAHAGFGQRERREVGLADLRQPLALLLLRAEQQQRLRQPDRLVRREQRRDAGVPHPGQHQRAVVVHLRKPEPAVLLRHLHAQRADLLEAGDHLVRDHAVALDRLWIDLGLQERAEDRHEPLALLDGVGRHLRLRGDQIGLEVAEVEPLAEARQLPVLLPSSLRDRSSLLVTGISGHASPAFRHRSCGWKPGTLTGRQTAQHAAPAPSSARIPTPVWRTTVPPGLRRPKARPRTGSRAPHAPMANVISRRPAVPRGGGRASAARGA